MWTLLLLACSQPADLPSPLGPPSFATLPYASLVVGHPARAVVVTDAPAGTVVQLWMAERSSTACAPGVPGGCLALTSPVLVGQGSVGADGLARVSGPAPAGTSTSWYAQAAVLTAPVLMTRTSWTRVSLAASDDDRDGLPAGLEGEAWLSPQLADSDDGGVHDFQELLVDATDGADPRDDRPGERACADAADDDSDGLADCDDPDCGCGPEVCDDGADNDRDGLADCEDAACLDAPGCAEQSCQDGLDDDGDGAVDCADEDCWSATCHDATLAWVLAGRVERTSSLSSHYGPSATHHQASGVIGRVRVVDGTQVETCTWRVALTRHSEVWPATFWGALIRPGSTHRSRVGFVVDPACEVGEDILPPIEQAMWPMWYGPWAGSTGGYQIYYHWAGPLLRGDPWGDCPAGNAPVMAFEDRDGDGFGLDGVDRLGELGGRVWLCDPPGPQHVQQAGDCDDADPQVNPATIRLAPGASCRGYRPWDQDADGFDATIDPDDHDGRVP